MHNRWFAFVVSLVCAACGGGGLGKPIAQFPAREDLEALGAPPAAPAPRTQTLSVEHWTLELQEPASDHAYPVQTFCDKALQRELSLGKSQLELSPELRCAAQEVARFYTLNGAFPDDGLRAHILARCGSALGHVSWSTVTLEAEDSRSEQEVESALSQSVQDLVGQLKGTRGAVALGYARGQGRAVLALFQGTAKATLERFSPLVEGDHFVLSGRLEDEAASAMALVAQGKYGVALCEPDRSLRTPRFEFTCPMAPDDTEAVVEVTTRRPERLLAEPVLHVLMRRSAAAGLEYTATAGAAGPAGQDFPSALLSALNQARAAAHAPALELEPRQSQFNQKLTPHFLVASYAQNAALADLVALGVLAGWDVNGTIRGGGVFYASASTEDAQSWLSRALEAPLGRWTLLDPEMTRIAIGAMHVKPSGMLALVTTYAFFESKDHSADEDAIFEELQKQRAAHGVSEPLRRQRGQEMTAALQRIATHERTSGGALQEVLERSSAALRVPVQGWVVETSDLSLIRLDESLLAPGNVSVEVGVTHYRAPGGAWGQYVVLLVFSRAKDDGGGRRARLDVLPSRVSDLR